MPLLEAFLALALTMLSLATIATLFVEFFHRLARTRAKDLQGMLEEFYDSELKKLVTDELKKMGTELDKHKKEFIDRLITNPLLSGKPSEVPGYIKSSLKPLTSLSTEDFFKRLAYTDIGKKMKAKTEMEIDEFVESLSLAYDGFGAAATDLFKRRAQIVSLAAGILVAFGLNVNALLVFQSYLDDPVARAKVVAQVDAISAKYQDKVDKGELQGFKTKEEAEGFVRTIKQDIGNLENMGITAGYSWDVPPGKLWRKDVPSTIEAPNFLESLRGTVFWGLGVLATGLLIGLGGPFWFNIVRKLTDVIQVARGGGGGGTATTAAEASKTTGATVVDPMKSAKDTFKKSDEPPPLVKAQANWTAATKAATDADNAVKAAADAANIAQGVATFDPGNQILSAAVVMARESLTRAIDAKSRMDKAKDGADKLVADAEANRHLLPNN